MKLPISVTLRQRGGVQGPSPAPSGRSSRALPRWKACLPWRPRSIVPEHPRLAPGVELCGELAESGFAQQQWLAQRDGRYIQLSELLYRVAEHADGERTPAEMAAAVTAAIGKRVTEDNVRHLLKRKLIPAGVVAPAEGVTPSAAAGGRPAGAGSPLAVRMKMAMVGSRLIDPVAGVLQVFYWPPLLLAMLAASAVALRWVFVVHGIGRAVAEVLYQPALLLATLGLMVIAAAFHEFGHAAALRYGGGRARSMGFGVYLVYPAFYTDVSENYRLGRWARVRTDLGGFYFNLIFCLGLLGVYFITGHEFLLIVIVAIIFDIVRQSMPFVRLDGYWALADITGIPDFFSNIGPFLRSLLPLPFWKGRTLPPLKLWVKLVYLLYILVTVPLLLFILFVMLKTTPHILATARHSLAMQWAGFGLAWRHGDALQTATSAVQMLALALPVLGLLFMLGSLGRTLVTLIWRWSRPTPPRRVAGALALAGIAAALVWLWAPQVPAAVPAFGGEPGPLYARTSAGFVPLGPEERGTIGDGLGDLSVRHTSSSQAAAPTSATPPATVWPTPQATPEPTAQAPAQAIPQPGPRPAPTPTPPPTRQPSPQPAPSLSVAAPAAATAAPSAPATATPTPAAAPPSAAESPQRTAAPAVQPTTPTATPLSAAPSAPQRTPTAATATATPASTAPAGGTGAPASPRPSSPTPTSTPTASPGRAQPSAGATAIGPASLRTAPTEDALIVGTAPTGTTITVVGCNSDCSWLLVATNSGTFWTARYFWSVHGDLSGLAR